MRILSWITHARRPLSVDELRYGLAVEYYDNDEDDEDSEGDVEELNEDNLLSPRSLVDVCAGLVIIDSTSQIIRLVHHTTQEYFDKARLYLFGNAEIDLSRACLTYLSYKTSTESMTIPLAFDEAPKWHPFFDYAARHWFSHVRSGLLLQDPAPVFLDAVARLKSSDSVLSLTVLLYKLSQQHLRVYYFDPNFRTRFDRNKNTRTTPLEIASYMGLEELVTVLLDYRTGFCPELETSLILASYKGYLNVVKLLLIPGVTVDSTVQTEGILDGRITALSVACTFGNLPVARVLIENGADIHDQALATLPPFHAAVAHENSDLFNFLLKEGVDINSRDSIGQRACHVVAKYSIVDAVKYLLDAHCDLDLTDNNRQNARYHAAAYVRLDTIQLLLDRGADASAKNNKVETARNLLARHLSTLEPQILESAQRLMHRLLQLEKNLSSLATNDP